MITYEISKKARTYRIPTYWVLAKDTEETIARCNNKEIADWIADNFPMACMVRVTFKEITE